MLSLALLDPGPRIVELCLIVAAAVTVLSCAACFASWLLRRRPAHRHGVLLSALVATLACPWLAAMFVATGTSFVAIPAPTVAEAPATSPDTRPDFLRRGASTPHAVPEGDRTSPALPSLEPPPQGERSVTPATNTLRARSAAAALPLLWALGTLVATIRMILGALRRRRLRLAMRPSSDRRIDLALREARRLVGARTSPAVMVSPWARAPHVSGLLRPVIVLPAGLIGAIRPDQLRDVLTHELAHIERRDHLVVVLQAAAQAAFWPIPSVYLLNRRLSDAREDICDNYVLAGRDAVSYGETLLRVAQWACGATAPFGTVGFITGRGRLEQRISRLIHEGRNTMTRIHPSVAIGLLVAFMAMSTLLCATTIGAPQSDEREAINKEQTDPAKADNSAATEKQSAADESANSADVQRAESKLTVRVKNAEGESISAAYLTLWRALTPDESAPKSHVSGPAGNSGIDYYQTVVWQDQETDARWVRERSAHPNDGSHGQEATEFQFEELPPGRYRVSVVSYRPDQQTPDPTPFGVSEPIELDGLNEKSAEVPLSSGDAALTLKILDREAGKPVPHMAVQLRDSKGMPIVHGHGTGNFFERTDESGEVHFASLPAGTYTVRVMGKAASVNNFVEYAPLEDDSTIQIAPGDKLLEIGVSPRRLEQAEIDRRFPFSIFGRVTDQNGNPLAGVEVRAATGIGTLLGGGQVTTDADGRYRLYFGGGVAMQVTDATPLGIGVQAAHLMVELDGWELANEEGYLFYLMTDSTPEQFQKLLQQDGQVWSKSSADEVVFAHQPREVNFQMRQ